MNIVLRISRGSAEVAVYFARSHKMGLQTVPLGGQFALGVPSIVDLSTGASKGPVFYLGMVW